MTYTVTESEDVYGEVPGLGLQGSVATTLAGSEGFLTFEATLGMRVSAVTGFTGSGCERYAIINPSGAVVQNVLECGAAQFFEPFTVTESGTWSLRVDPDTFVVGPFTATVYEVPAEGETVSAFDAVRRTASVAIPGATHAFLLDGVAGQRVSINTTFVATTYSGCWTYKLLAPSGAVARAPQLACGGHFTDVVTLAETGTFRWVADGSTWATADVSTTAYLLPNDPVVAGAINGGATALALTTPGLNGTVTFVGGAGDAISVVFTNAFGCTNYGLFAPSGASLVSDYSCGTPFFDKTVLSDNGTYTITVDPGSTATGTVSVNVREVPPDLTATLTIGALPTPFVVTVPGQNLAPTFVGTAGLAVSYVSDVSTGFHDYRLLASDGSVVQSLSNKLGDYTSPAITLPADDIYTLSVNPRGAITPTVNLSVRLP